MPDDLVVCDPDDLLRFTREVLVRLGADETDAHDMAAQIVGSELSGHESHGLRRLPEYVKRVQQGYADAGARPAADLDRGALVRIDGGFGFGHIVMRDATRMAVERAKECGVAVVAVHRSEPAGRFVDFCEWAAERGVATLMFVNSAGGGQVVAPPGAIEARMSTNPIAAGIPRAESPHLVLDMATSTVAMGRVSEWRDRGEELPTDWADGDGLLRFLGGGKGFGLALVAEALAGALTTAGTVSADPAGDRQGVLIIAIDVDGIRPLSDFTAEVERFIDYVKDVPVAPDASGVRVPGESSAVTARERASGTPLQPFTWNRVLELAASLGVAPPSPSES